MTSHHQSRQPSPMTSHLTENHVRPLKKKLQHLFYVLLLHLLVLTERGNNSPFFSCVFECWMFKSLGLAFWCSLESYPLLYHDMLFFFFRLFFFFVFKFQWSPQIFHGFSGLIGWCFEENCSHFVFWFFMVLVGWLMTFW